MSPLAPLLGHTSDTLIEKSLSLKAYCAAHVLLGESCCSCQGDCLSRTICCKLHDWSNLTTNALDEKDEKVLKETISILLQETETYKRRSCRPIFPPRLSNGYQSNSYFMVNTCSPGTSETNQHRCLENVDEHNKTLHPVSDGNGELYKNYYCAKCNQAKEIKGVFLIRKCKYNNTLAENDCILSIGSSDSSALLCTNREDDRACAEGNPYYNRCQKYKKEPTENVNYFCNLCINGYNLSSHTYLKGECATWGTKIYPYTTKFCYDTACHYSNTVCNYPAYCPAGYMKQYGNCVRMSPEMYKTVDFDECFSELKVKLFFVDTFDMYDFKISEMPKLETVYRDKYYSVVKTQTAVNDQIIRRIIRRPKKGFIVFHQDEDSIAYKVALGLSRIFPGKRLCAKTVNLWTKRDATFMSDCRVNYNQHIFTLGNLSIWKSYGYGGMKRRLYSCQSFYLPVDHCRLRTLESNVNVDENLTLRHTENGIESSYKTEDYLPLGPFSYGVCIEEKESKKYSSSFYTFLTSIQSILSLVCTITSIVTYAVAISLFLCIRESQNNLWILILCVFLAIDDTAFLALALTSFFQMKVPVITCHVVRSINQLFALSSHFWKTSVVTSLSFNNWLVHKSHLTSESVNIKRSAFISLLLSLIFVVLGLFFSEKGILDAAHTIDASCASHEFYSRTILQLIPIVLCTAVSFTFLYSSYCLRPKYGNVTAADITDGKVIESNFNFLVKIVVVCAFTDIVNYIHIPDDSGTDEHLQTNMIFTLLSDTARLFRGVSILFIIAFDVYRRKIFRGRKPGRVDAKTSQHSAN